MKAQYKNKQASNNKPVRQLVILLDIIVHTYSQIFGRLRQEYNKFRVCLGYRINSNLAYLTYENVNLKIKTKVGLVACL